MRADSIHLLKIQKQFAGKEKQPFFLNIYFQGQYTSLKIFIISVCFCMATKNRRFYKVFLFRSNRLIIYTTTYGRRRNTVNHHPTRTLYLYLPEIDTENKVSHKFRDIHSNYKILRKTKQKRPGCATYRKQKGKAIRTFARRFHLKNQGCCGAETEVCAPQRGWPATMCGPKGRLPLSATRIYHRKNV